MFLNGHARARRELLDDRHAQRRLAHRAHAAGGQHGACLRGEFANRTSTPCTHATDLEPCACAQFARKFPGRVPTIDHNAPAPRLTTHFLKSGTPPRTWTRRASTRCAHACSTASHLCALTFPLHPAGRRPPLLPCRRRSSARECGAHPIPTSTPCVHSFSCAPCAISCSPRSAPSS